MTEVKNGTQEARQYLQAADALIKKSLSWVKQQCAGEKGVSNEKLDAHQMASFDLAWCAAEATAARFAVEYADKLAAAAADSDGLCLEERMARAFCAEALQNIHNRFWARPQSFGLHAADLAAFASSALATFCQAQLDADNLAALGREVVALEGDSGAYMLGDDALMMQDAFRRLATNVVMPLAEEIHREDRIIPQEILDPLTEMGCFGLSIPERYGGIQSDDHEDNMGMIVVTEELSRGSLGAAGSLITRPEILSRALQKGGTEEQRQKWLPLGGDGRPAVCHCRHRTGYRLRRCCHAPQGEQVRWRLAARRRQDLVHHGRQSGCSPGSGTFQPRPRAWPQGLEHVPGRKGLL
jgi:(2S)-methylsuccinyl-CoA dehydrogenase